jgi:AcrR family transcriptional regulator
MAQQSMAEDEVNNRTKFLWIAAKLFLSKGYAASSVDEIAAAAGTSAPALYRLFESKQDLLDQVCLAGMEDRMKGIHKAVSAGHGDPYSTLRLLVRQRIDFAFGPWGYQAPITLADYQHLSPPAARQLDAASEFGRSEWFRCMAQIRPEASTRELLSMIYSVLMEITFVALHLDDLGPVDDVCPTLERIAMAGLTGKY